MPSNVRQVSILACILLVVLRISIGWQFLYEGLWKYNTLKTAKPWSAEGYLANARGPLRETFRGLVDDPDGLKKLDYDTMVARWEDWKNRFIAHYPTLKQEQLDDLDRILEGSSEFTANLAELPPEVDLKKFRPRKYKAPEGWYLRYNSTGKTRRLETNLHLLPQERDALLMLVEPQPQTEDEVAAYEDPRVPKPELSEAAKKYQEAINRLYKASGRLGLKERLQVLLKEDPKRVGPVTDESGSASDPPGEQQVYENMLFRYEQELKGVKETFQQDHLANKWGKILAKKAEVVGPVDALTAEFRDSAYKLLDRYKREEGESYIPEQVSRGPVPEPPSRIGQINTLTIWSLILLGGALMVGFFSRFAALGAAGLLLLFYLPLPPWPGVPEAPGPEHSLFVNKNLIEFFACLALASLPTGRWVGLDSFIRRFVFGRKTD